MIALVVEDDLGLRQIYKHILQRLDFTVYEASNGQEAIDLLGSLTPNILFLDMLLPEVNGMTVLNYIINSGQVDKMYTAIISSNKQYASLVKPSSHIQFLLKPVRPHQIEQLVAEALSPS